MSDLTVVARQLVKTNEWGEVLVWTQPGLAYFDGAPEAGWKELFDPRLYLTAEADSWLLSTPTRPHWATVTMSDDRLWWYLTITFDNGDSSVWRRRSILVGGAEWFHQDYDLLTDVTRWTWPD